MSIPPRSCSEPDSEGNTDTAESCTGACAHESEPRTEDLADDHGCHCEVHTDQGGADGSTDTPEDTEFAPAPTVDSPAPDSIAELCAQCANYVARALAMPLDFTAETLPILDHYLTLVRSASDERPALLELVANAAGAYFGELVRQRIDGFWLMPTPDVHDWYVCARSVYFKFNPIGVVHEVIAQSTSHSGPGGEFHLARDERALIADRLAAVPAVSTDHYYLLTTRLEAIDIVIETLRWVLNEGGQELSLEPEDYESLD